MLPIVLRTVAVRDTVIHELDALAKDKFVVSIGGNPQDDAMRAVAKPVLERELRARLASLNRDLDSYGVAVDPTAGLAGRSPSPPLA